MLERKEEMNYLLLLRNRERENWERNILLETGSLSSQFEKEECLKKL